VLERCVDGDIVAIDGHSSERVSVWSKMIVDRVVAVGMGMMEDDRRWFIQMCLLIDRRRGSLPWIEVNSWW